MFVKAVQGLCFLAWWQRDRGASSQIRQSRLGFTDTRVVFARVWAGPMICVIHPCARVHLLFSIHVSALHIIGDLAAGRDTLVQSLSHPYLFSMSNGMNGSEVHTCKRVGELDSTTALCRTLPLSIPMQTQAREFDLLSSVDTLMAVGEPFGLHLHLWGAKKKKNQRTNKIQPPRTPSCRQAEL